MILKNLSHFLIITQAELCLKGTFVKARSKFTIFLDIYENPRRKKFIKSCPKHLKVINWNEKCHNFYFYTSLWCFRKVSSFQDTEKKSDNKNCMHFSPLFHWDNKGNSRKWGYVGQSKRLSIKICYNKKNL